MQSFRPILECRLHYATGSICLWPAFDLPQPRRRFPQRPRPYSGRRRSSRSASSQSESSTPTSFASLNGSEWQPARHPVASPCRTDRASSEGIHAGFRTGNVTSSPWRTSRRFLTTRGAGPVVPIRLPHRMGTAGRYGRCLGTAVGRAKFESEYAGSRSSAAERFPSFRQRTVKYAGRFQQIQKTHSLPGE